MGRALLWLGAGLLALVALVLLTTPELVGANPSVVVTLVGVVLLAGVPGLLIVALLAARRARHGDHTQPDPPAHAHPHRRT